MYCKSASRSKYAFSQSVLGGAAGSAAASIADTMAASVVAKVVVIGSAGVSFGSGGLTFAICELLVK
jgi:hypothetical protein